MNEIIIVGGGGFGREVHDWLVDVKNNQRYYGEVFHIKGFLDHNQRCLDGFQGVAGVIGSPDDYQICENDRFVLAVGKVDVRKKLIRILKKKGASFFSLIHPTAIVSKTAMLGEGVMVCPFGLVNSHAQLGDFVLLNIFASVAHDAKIGDHSVLCPYATVNGFAKLGEEVFMATHSTVIPSISVGKGATISANSVATRNVPPGSVVFGVPGKFLQLDGNAREQR